jgi:L,D-peptidoglycan transpeptidase YkuD (ErfK/YbiS/YcfS/YnhG family)
MGAGRVLSSCAALAAIAGCAALAVGMGRAATEPDGGARPHAVPSLTAEPEPPVGTRPPRRARSAPATAASATSAAVARPARPAARSAPARRPVGHHPPATRPASTRAAAPQVGTPAPRRAPKPAPTPAPPRGGPLPVAGSTGAATRVITVRAPTYASTTATLQAWDAASGGGWRRHGPAIPAHVGSDGLSTTPSESRSATPVGSFTLTQAFGAFSDPGTALPYFQTDAADWWISQAGPLYNTHQHCGSGCAFTRGAPNEHLAATLPFYRYAVVIDYNTRAAPGGVHQGAGSAFFLHVTDGNATAGCVAIAQSSLVPIMQWLTPSAHPRILIGVA